MHGAFPHHLIAHVRASLHDAVWKSLAVCAGEVGLALPAANVGVILLAPPIER